MADLSQLVGTSPLLGLLSEQEQAQAKERAMNQGLLNLGVALLQGSQGRPGQGRPRLGQIAATAVPAALQGYQGAFDQQLKDMLTSMQLKDMMAKREREANLQKAIQSAYKTQPVAGLGLGAEQLLNPITQAEFEAFGQSAYADAAKTAAPTERVLDRGKALEALAQYGGPEGMSAYLAATKPEKQVFTDTFANTALSMYGTADVNKLTPPQRLAVQEAVNAGKKPLVVMNQGQQGFSNEMDLKKAFTGEPVYKAGQEVRSAFDQIKTSLAKESPAGDLAAATKFMKLLDPGSVVRESELFMAMNATGLLDRYMNYADMAIKGTKLSPQQRKDFGDLSIQLYNAAANAYNKKYSEYSTLGTGFGLDAKRALGEPMQTFQPGPTKTGSSIDAINAEIKRRGL